MAIIRARQTGQVGGVVRQAAMAEGPGVSGVPGAIAGLAGAIGDAVLQGQVEASRDARQAVLHDATAQLTRWENERLHGPDGYFKQRGRNAIDAFPQVDEDYQQQIATIAESIQDEETRTRFQRAAELRALDASRMAGNHFVKESDAYQHGQFNAILTSEQARAGMNASDAVATANSLARQFEVIADYAERKGLSREQRYQMEDEASKQTYAMVFEQLLASEDFAEAERLIESEVVQKRLGPQLATQVESRLRDASSLSQAQQYADDILREMASEGPITRESMVMARARAREELSGEQEVRTLQQINQAFNDQLVLREAQLDEELTETTNAILGAGTRQAAQMVINAADDELKLSLTRLADSQPYAQAGRPQGRESQNAAQHAANQIKATQIRDAITAGMFNSRARVYERAAAEGLPAKIQDDLAKFYDKPPSDRFTPSLLADALSIVTDKPVKSSDNMVGEMYEAVLDRLQGEEPTLERVRQITAVMLASGEIAQPARVATGFANARARGRVLRPTETVTGFEAARMGARAQETFVPDIEDDLLQDLGINTRQELVNRFERDMATRPPEDRIDLDALSPVEQDRALGSWIRTEYGGFPTLLESFETQRDARREFLSAAFAQTDQMRAMEQQQAARLALADNTLAEMALDYVSPTSDFAVGVGGMRIDLDNAAMQGETPQWMTEALEAYGASQSYEEGLRAQETATDVSDYIMSQGLVLLGRMSNIPQVAP